MINDIVQALGEYTPIILDDGTVVTNWAQIAAYVLVVIAVYCLFRIIARVVVPK